jgi:hypothetical protein
MRKVLTLIALLGGMSLSVLQAQTNKPSAAESIGLDYAEKLNLNEDQRTMATKVFAEHLKVSRENWASTDGDREAFAKAQQATFKTTDTKIKALLDDEQLMLYKEHREMLRRKALDFYVAKALEE